MGRDIQEIGRRVGTPNIQLPRASVGEQLIGTLQQFSTQIGKIGETIATEQAIEKGIAARERGEEVRLAPSITKPTAAFNQAFRDTDARMVTRSGLSLLDEATARATNPANVGTDSLINYESEVQGIIQGTLAEALPENRRFIQDALMDAAAKGKGAVRKSVMDFDNKVLMNEFNHELTRLKDERTAAILDKDQDALEKSDLTIAKFVADWNEISPLISEQIPGIVSDIAEKDIESFYMANFIDAQAQGKGGEFLFDFASSRKEDLTPQMQMGLVEQMNKIQRTTKSAELTFQANTIQEIENAMDDPLSPEHISSQEQLEQTQGYEFLSPLQQNQLSHKLIQKNAAAAKQQAKFNEAFQDIAWGRAAFVPGAVKNELFDTGLQNIEQQKGGRATLPEMFNVVQTLQTDVPKFNSLMSSMLTSGSPQDAAAAASLYSAAGLSDKGELINLSGDALTIAEKLNTQFNLTANPDEKTIQGVLDQVLKKTEPEVQDRMQLASKTWAKHGNDFYKQVFGEEANPLSNQGALSVFKEAWFGAMANASTPEEAERVTRNSMRAWGTSKWYQDGWVGIAAPEKMLPMSQGTESVRHQVMFQFNDIAKRNEESILSNQGGVELKFSGDVKIPDKISEEDFLFQPIDQLTPQQKVDQATPLVSIAPVAGIQTIKNMSEVRVVYDGVESNLKLLPGQDALASPGQGIVYALMAENKFGVYEQLPDPGSPDGLAYVVLNDLDTIAPRMMETQADARLIENFEKGRARQRQVEIAESYLSQIPVEARQRFSGRAKLVGRVKQFFESIGQEQVDIGEVSKTVAEQREVQLQKDLETITGGAQ